MIGRDAKTDLAILKVEPHGKLVPVTFGDFDAVRVGDWVLAIGNPFGFGGTVTAGIISARGRDIQAGPYDNFLPDRRVDQPRQLRAVLCSITAGEVIGINTAILSPRRRRRHRFRHSSAAPSR